jgi:hypothetical protein
MRIPSIIVTKILSSADAPTFEAYLNQLLETIAGATGIFWHYNANVRQAFIRDEDLKGAGEVSLSMIVNATQNNKAKNRLPRIFGKTSSRLAFLMRTEHEDWCVSIILAYIPQIDCTLYESNKCDQYESKFRYWVNSGLANEIDYYKKPVLMHWCAGDLLGFYLRQVRTLSRKVDRLQMKYHGLESQHEACEIVELLKHAFQIWPYKPSLFLTFPASKPDIKKLLSVCNDEIRTSLGEKQWMRINQYLNLRF